MHALTSLVSIFSLAKAILDGDWSKTIINIMQMAMGAVVVAPVVVVGVVIIPQLITPTTLPLSQLLLLPPSLYVTKMSM